MKRIKFLFAWYDLWIGFFWDSKKKWLYILPLPMIGIIINLNYEKRNVSRVTPAKTVEEAEEWCKRQLERKFYK